MAGLFPPFDRFERFSVFSCILYFGSKGFRIFLILIDLDVSKRFLYL